MSLPKAKPGEVIDVRPFGAALADARTTALFKTDDVEVIRMVMPAGKTLDEHRAPGAITLHCLEGKISITALGETRELEAGELIYLPPRQPHAVSCIEGASFLLTILLGASD